jgi:hypothetical protein
VLRRTANRIATKTHCGNLRRHDYVTQKQPKQRLEAAPYDDAIKARTSERTIMETPAKQTPTASSEIIMLIRKLRWAGLEEKAEQLEKELEQSAITNRVVPIQTETD